MKLVLIQDRHEFSNVLFAQSRVRSSRIARRTPLPAWPKSKNQIRLRIHQAHNRTQRTKIVVVC